jgi:hypothetical protein
VPLARIVSKLADLGCFRFNDSTAASSMKTQDSRTLRVFAIELAIYAALVTGYFFLVLHLMGDWLYRLEMQHRVLYAVVALALIAGQAIVLDGLASVLLRFLRSRWR